MAFWRLEKQMSHNDFCPACKKVVSYEEYNGDLSCSICGRTKRAAQMSVEAEASDRRRKSKAVWVKRGKYAVYVLIILGLGMYFVFFSDASLRGRVMGMAVITTLVFVLGGLIYGVRAAIRHFSRRGRR
jgi:hypothetical protein